MTRSFCLLKRNWGFQFSQLTPASRTPVFLAYFTLGLLTVPEKCAANISGLADGGSRQKSDERKFLCFLWRFPENDTGRQSDACISKTSWFCSSSSKLTAYSFTTKITRRCCGVPRRKDVWKGPMERQLLSSSPVPWSDLASGSPLLLLLPTLRVVSLLCRGGYISRHWEARKLSTGFYPWMPLDWSLLLFLQLCLHPCLFQLVWHLVLRSREELRGDIRNVKSSRGLKTLFKFHICSTPSAWRSVLPNLRLIWSGCTCASFRRRFVEIE